MKKEHSEVFTKSFELANILNLQLANNFDHTLPSKTSFKWTQANYNRFNDFLNELKTLIKYDENGNSIESYEMIMNMKGIALVEAEMSTIKELTDGLYAKIYHYSDRWSLSTMASTVSYFEHLTTLLIKDNIIKG